MQPAAWVAETVTVKLQVSVAPSASVAVQVTVVVPTEKLVPEAGLQTVVNGGTSPVTVGAAKVTRVAALTGVRTVTFDEQVISMAPGTNTTIGLPSDV